MGKVSYEVQFVAFPNLHETSSSGENEMFYCCTSPEGLSYIDMDRDRDPNRSSTTVSSRAWGRQDRCVVLYCIVISVLCWCASICFTFLLLSKYILFAVSP